MYVIGGSLRRHVKNGNEFYLLRSSHKSHMLGYIMWGWKTGITWNQFQVVYLRTTEPRQNL